MWHFSGSEEIPVFLKVHETELDYRYQGVSGNGMSLLRICYQDYHFKTRCVIPFLNVIRLAILNRRTINNPEKSIRFSKHLKNAIATIFLNKKKIYC